MKQHPVSASSDVPAGKARRIGRIAAIIALILLAIALPGIYLGSYLRAERYAGSGDFAAAERALLAQPITQLHAPKLTRYIRAGLLLTDGRYPEARDAFESLPGYLQADMLEMECEYLYAQQLADAGELTSAIAAMQPLAEADYRDAGEKLLEFQYRQATVALYQNADYAAACDAFALLAARGYDNAAQMRQQAQYLWARSLMDQGDLAGAYQKLASIRDFSDADALRAALREALYADGQARYAEKDYGRTRALFAVIPGYLDSGKYLTLANAHLSDAALYPEQTAQALTKIFEFEDAAELLLSGTDIACFFLLGSWKTADGTYFFDMEQPKEGGFLNSYDLPWYSGPFTIRDGIYYVDDKGVERPQFAFTLLTLDSMEVYCYKDGSTYTLYR